jgi:hypothetical protein
VGQNILGDHAKQFVTRNSILSFKTDRNILESANSEALSDR